MKYLAGQLVAVDHPSGGVVGLCSFVDYEDGETASVLTKYEPRGERRHVGGVPVASMAPRSAPAHFGTYGDGADPRGHGAVARLAHRIVEHSQTVGSPMRSDEATNRARAIAGRNHGKTR